MRNANISLAIDLLERYETTGKKSFVTAAVDLLNSALAEGDQHDKILQQPTSINVDLGSLSIKEKEIQLITQALRKHKTKKKASEELGISERTLYRKIKDYDLTEIDDEADKRN